MKILKLLNKKNFSILIIYLLYWINLSAEDKPIDLWNLEKNETDIIEESIISSSNQNIINKDSIYELQSNKEIIIIDKFFLFNNFKIFI